MAKILKNITLSPINISDTGITIPASDQYTIPSQDDLLWAASDDIIVQIGAGNIVVNDGSVDLSISDGTNLIKGIFPKKIGLVSGDDFTAIGHTNDDLHVKDREANNLLNLIAIALGTGSATFYEYSNEANITNRNKNDFTSVHTVSTGKTFILTAFNGSYDAQGTIYIRLEKQVNGSGPWITKERIVLMANGNGQSNGSIDCGTGIKIGVGGDKIKITVESSLSKGSVFAQFAGNEI